MKSPRVKNVTEFWTSPPPAPSDRCQEWLSKFAAGWKPNRRIDTFGYHESAEWYGVWIWEYLNVIMPAIHPR